ncbi:transmembrane protein 131 [Camelus ferus]|nr:transmembrane protein 131 [Camelus ferus]
MYSSGGDLHLELPTGQQGGTRKLWSVRPTPQNDAITVHFKPITLKASESKYTKVASISFDAEPKVQPGVAMQEDMWDADWDLHQSLFKGWAGIKENSGHRLSALFEVNTDLQKNILSKITAELSWPSVLSSPRHVRFPLTNTNCSSEEEITLENPADVPVYVQFIPLALYSNPSVFVDKLISRNNLTVMDAVMVQGQGTTENLRVAGKLPGPGSSLRFKITEALLKDCTDSLKLREPNFTLKRTFKVENTGQLQIHIETIEVSGYSCEGYGFKVVNCQEFTLSANASKDIIILFTPDFTASRVIRELKFITTSGSEFVFVLNASLPYHMLAACAEALPRPNWELALYIIISGIMSLNTLSCDPGHGRGFCGAGGTASRPGAGSHKQCGPSVHPHSGHSNRNSADVENVRAKNSTSTSSRTNAQSASKASPLVLDSNAVAQGHAAGRKSRGARQSQHSSQHHGHSALEQQSPPPPPPGPPHQDPQPERLSPAPLAHPPHPEHASSTRHSSEDSDITSLIEAMDKDFDHHDSPPLEVFTEQPPSPLSKSKGKGKPLQRKVKAPKKQEEKEKKGKGKAQEDELKDSLADDDSSSTTTETSNPDTEPLLKEVRPLGPRACDPHLLGRAPAQSERVPCAMSTCSEGAPGAATPHTVTVTQASVVTRHGAATQRTSAHQEGASLLVLSSRVVTGVRGSSAATDSLYKLSLQTLNADIFLKQRQTSPPPASPSPPAAPCPFASRGSYSSVVNSSPGSDPKMKQPSGSKHKLTKAASLPGKNGNPTFAAVTAGYDKSPEVFSKLGLSRSCNQASQRSWNELSSGPSYLWDSPATDPSPSWPTSSGSPTHTATSILGNTSGLWSTTPFSSSIWSSNLNSTLPFPSPTTSLTSIGLPGPESPSAPHTAAVPSATADLGQTYNPWRIWGPTIGRRSSDPWSNSHFPHEN